MKGCLYIGLFVFFLIFLFSTCSPLVAWLIIGVLILIVILSCLYTPNKEKEESRYSYPTNSTYSNNQRQSIEQTIQKLQAASVDDSENYPIDDKHHEIVKESTGDGTYRNPNSIITKASPDQIEESKEVSLSTLVVIAKNVADAMYNSISNLNKDPNVLEVLHKIIHNRVYR